MSLMAKLRAPILGVMLGAAALGVSNGCTTITPWRTVDTEQRQIEAEKTITEKASTKEMGTREFQISDPYIEGRDYVTKITESLEKSVYSLEKETTTMKVQDITTLQREQKTEVLGPILFGTLTIGGAAGGAVVGENLDKDGFFGKIGGGIVGALVGGLVGVWLGEKAPAFTRKETKKEEGFVRDIVLDEKTKETFLRTDSIYKDKLGANVIFGFQGYSQSYKSPTGIVRIQDRVIGLPIPNYWFPTKKILEEKLLFLPLIQEIKPTTRETLKDRFLDASLEKIYEFVMETREQSNSSTKVKNASKNLKMMGYELSDRAIYGVIEQFIDEKINSSIKTLSFNVRDDLTHVPIGGTRFEFQTDAPKKSELAERYFTGNLKGFAEEKIRDYITGTFTAESCPDMIDFMVYSPSNIFLEVTHPDYNFVSGEINIKGDTKKTIYMVDKGSKVRVQKTGESQGRIE